jgi:hypothetical protein
MKVALLAMIASALTRRFTGAMWVADGLWFAAAFHLTLLFHHDMALGRARSRELPEAASVRAIRA